MKKKQFKTTRESWGEVIYDILRATESPFSKQKLKYGTFGSNPILNKFPEINLKKGSKIYVVTDSNEYSKVKGVYYDPPIMLDEADPHSPFYKINKMRIALKKAKVDIRKGRYKKALDNVIDALKILKHLEISLRFKRK